MQEKPKGGNENSDLGKWGTSAELTPMSLG